MTASKARTAALDAAVLTIPFGRTGRVTLESQSGDEDVVVAVDGTTVARVMCPRTPRFTGWGAVFEHGYLEGVPNLDAAVMWVLQHAVGSDRERTKAIRDVWRAERPVVWRVLRFGGRWIADPAYENLDSAWSTFPTFQQAISITDRRGRTTERARQVTT